MFRRLGFDRQFNLDWTFLLAQRAAKFRQRDVLQLPNALPRHAEFLPNFLERFGFAAVQPEALEHGLAVCAANGFVTRWVSLFCRSKLHGIDAFLACAYIADDH